MRVIGFPKVVLDFYRLFIDFTTETIVCLVNILRQLNYNQTTNVFNIPKILMIVYDVILVFTKCYRYYYVISPFGTMLAYLMRHNQTI